MNSKLIIASGIKLDKNYANVLSYDTNDMLSLVESHEEYSENNYNYIDYTKNEIMANVDYSVAMSCNYIAFQNPRHGNKWYFAFIDDVKYKAPNQCLIIFTIDVWSTFFDNWSSRPCFVVREHVNDDTPGKHTVPENVTTGDYIIIGEDIGFNDEFLNPRVVMSANIDEVGDPVLARVYNGLPSGFGYFKYDLGDSSQQEDFRNHINLIQTRNGNLNQLFIAPNWLLPGGYGGGEIQQSNTPKRTYKVIPSINSFKYEKNGNIETYTPVNKKLLTYPYCFYKFTNLQGQNAIIKQELWDNSTETLDGTTYTGKLVELMGVLSAGCSIRLFPHNYSEGGIESGINSAKFPQLNWATDPYINWLTQQGVNQMTNVVSGYMSGNPVEGVLKTNDLLTSSYQAYTSSPQAQGNLNAGDVMYARGFVNMDIAPMGLKKEYVQQIDDYFSRYGYKINEVKLPNIYGRQNFNFIEIGKDDCIGYGSLPSKYMEEINNICRQGVTIWHNHDNLGNYNINNPII